ncbi:MAG: sensor histidine kinase, partial [Acidobacteria bacterium]|nr:sensor histidine kinase [Acidobacteriota bacterium]
MAAVCAISLLHYGTSVHWILLHEIFKRLYYVPIVIAAVAYGTAAGLATSILASLLYLPHIVLDWRGLPVFAVERYG